jgi:serine/threonine protein phosphatase PrpC
MTVMLRVALRLVAAERDEDRVVHTVDDNGDVVVLADGAGGTSGGRVAADAVTRGCFRQCSSAGEAVSALRELDLRLSADADYGETTAVVARIRDGVVLGASIGDSRAWIIAANDVIDLTARQARKPLLGSGAAVVVGFGPVELKGRLLVASDGLFKYVTRTRIVGIAAVQSIERAAHELVAAARLPTGGLQDDLSLALVERP